MIMSNKRSKSEPLKQLSLKCFAKHIETFCINSNSRSIQEDVQIFETSEPCSSAFKRRACSSAGTLADSGESARKKILVDNEEILYMQAMGDDCMKDIEMLDEQCTHDPPCKLSKGFGVLTNNSTSCNFDFQLPKELSNQVLKYVFKAGKLNDDVAIFLSDTSKFRIEKLYIKGHCPITKTGIKRLLKNHKLTEINVKNINNEKIIFSKTRQQSAEISKFNQKITLKEIILNLNSWTKENLVHLNISGMEVRDNLPPIAVPIYLNGYRFRPLSFLLNLEYLDVSFTNFTDIDLNVIIMHLSKLVHIDISNTPVANINCLINQQAPKLRTLLMANMYKLSMTKEGLFNLFCKMQTLQVLDISYEQTGNIPCLHSQTNDAIGMMLVGGYALPNLKVLDISGREHIEERAFMNFYINHPQVEFYGLLQTNLDWLPCFIDEKNSHYRSYLTVTGTQNEAQITAALKCYCKRPRFTKAALFTLFNITQYNPQYNLTLLSAVLHCMRKHLKLSDDIVSAVQLAGSACVYNLTNREISQGIPVDVLSDVVGVTLDTMELFIDNQQLQKNCLLTLCSDRILKEVTFNYFRAAKLVMECLCRHQTQTMPRMAVAILSILAAKISTEETSILGGRQYMEILLQIAYQKLHEGTYDDITLKFTLSALWNLTDESPSTCKHFIECQGLNVFMEILENNLAEVRELHEHLLKQESKLLEKVNSLLGSKHIEVSYFAAGIISHLSMCGEEVWESCTGKSNLRQDMLQHLYTIVMQWDPPKGEMVAYRTFKPFFPLLSQHCSPAVQLWAAWAIDHVCSRNESRYRDMLKEESGSEYVDKILSGCKDQNVIALLKRIRFKLYSASTTGISD